MPSPFNSAKFMADPFFGEAITYAGVIGRHAVIEEGPNPASDGGIAKSVGRWATFTMLASEVSAPAYGDQAIQVDGTVWTVQRVERSGDVWKLDCVSQFRAARPKT